MHLDPLILFLWTIHIVFIQLTVFCQNYAYRTGTQVFMQTLFTKSSSITCTTLLLVVAAHLSEGSFVRNVVVQIPKFDAKPNPNPNHSPNPSHNPNLPMPILFGQMIRRTNDPSDK